MDFNDLIRNSVNEVLAETRTTEQPTAAPVQQAPQPITVNIQGQPVTFRDQADLEAQLNATAEAVRRQQAEAIAAQESATKAQGSRVTNDEDTGFSNEEYIRLMNEDPRKATNYALSHVLFDGKIENPAELIRETMIQQATTNRQLAAYQFRDSHREVPLEDPRVGNTIEQVRSQLGLPFSQQGLEAAYAYAIQKGQLPDFRAVAAAQAQQQTAQNQQFAANPYGQSTGQQPVYGQQPQVPQNPYLQAPPSPGRSSAAVTPVTIDDIENMSTDQLASLLTKLGGSV